MTLETDLRTEATEGFDSTTVVTSHKWSKDHLAKQEKDRYLDDAVDVTISECDHLAIQEKARDSGDVDVKIDESVDSVEACMEKAPDGGWGWWIVVGSCIVHVLTGGFERCSGIIYLELLDRFGQSATATSWVTSIATALRMFIGPLSSALCNRFSCRTVCAVGALFCTVGVTISVFASSLPFLYLSYGVLQGVGRSFVYTPCLIIVGYYFNKRRGIAVGLATSGGGLGTFVFPPVVELLFQNFGYFGAFAIMGAISGNLFVCSALFRPLGLHRKITRNDRLRKLRQNTASDPGSGKETLLTGYPAPMSITIGHQSLLSDQETAKLASTLDITANVQIESRKTSLFKRKISQVKLALTSTNSNVKQKKPFLDMSLFRNFAFSMLCLELFLFNLAFNIAFVYLPAIAKENGLSQMQGAVLVAIMGINDAWARIAISFFLDLKRVKPYRLILYNIIFFLKGLICMVIPLVRTFWQFALVCAVYGVLSGGCISQISVVIIDILGLESLTSSFGLVLLFQGMGSLVGPTIGGLFKDYLGSYTMSFYLGSIGIFVGGISLAAGNVWLYRKKRRDTE